MEKFIQIIRDSLNSVTHQRFFSSERGFQGQFLTELNKRLPNLGINDAIVEQEYQKRREEHGLRIRPDIIIHIPYDEMVFKSRGEGNFVVMELKLRASLREAFNDYTNLSQMCEILNYPLGVFINIDSRITYLDQYNGPGREKLIGFAVELDKNRNVTVFQ